MPKLSDFVFSGGVAGAAGSVLGDPTKVSYISVPANENISAGDVVVLASDNTAYYATDPANTFAQYLRPILNTVPQSFPAMSSTKATGLSNGSYGSLTIASCVLTNGNILLVSNIGTVNGYHFCITDPYGSIIQAAQQVGGNMGSYTPGYAPSCCALPSGGFVISGGYSNSGNTQWGAAAAFFVGNSTTPTVVSMQFVGVVSSSCFKVNCGLLSNGNVAFSWSIPNQGAYTAVWNPNTATVVTAATLVNSSTSAAAESVNGHALLPLTGGGYVMTYGDGVTNTTLHVVYLNNAGGQTASYNLTGAPGGIVSSFITMLQTGNIAVIATPDSGVTVGIAILNVSGGSVYSGNLALSTTASGAAQFAVSAGQSASTGFYVVVANAFGYAAIAYITATGTVMQNKQVAAVSNVNFNSPGLSATSDGGAVISCSNGNISGSLGVNFYKIAPATFSVGAAVSNANVGTYANMLIPLTPTWGAANPNACPFFLYSGSSVTPFISNLLGYTPLGVASAAATAGSSVQVAVTGSLATRLTFKQPYNVDARCNTPPGQAMNLAANVATMNGLQRLTPRNIN